MGREPGKSPPSAECTCVTITLNYIMMWDSNAAIRILKIGLSWAWWCILVIPVLGRLRKEDHAGSKPASDT